MKPGLIIPGKRININDPYSANTVLLLHGDGSLTDNSPAANSGSYIGNATVSTVQKKFGTHSFVFDGTGDGISYGTDSDFAFGTGDFTVEFWMFTSYPDTLDGLFQTGLLAGSQDSFHICISANTARAITCFYNDGTKRLDGNIQISADTWTHVAVTKSSGTLRIFVNGTLDVSTGTFTDTLTATHVRFGLQEQSSGDGFRAYTGYLDEIRVTKGVARYTASFTAPTAAFPNA